VLRRAFAIALAVIGGYMVVAESAILIGKAGS
jgi:hypothetical protein